MRNVRTPILDFASNVDQARSRLDSRKKCIDQTVIRSHRLSEIDQRLFIAFN